MNATKILGAGLICIDIVHDHDRTKIMNGGSCANVISVLSQIGYDCSIIRERYSDYLESVLSKTISSLGVKEIIYKDSTSNTPKVIEVLNGSKHEFLTCCPKCGLKILKLCLPTERDVTQALIDYFDYDVFYCDRTSPGIRIIMDRVRMNHGIVIYEPNTARNLDSLLESAKHADVIKFSKERVPPKIAERIRTTITGLKVIILTEGAEGLSFSHVLENGKMSEWIHVPSEFNGPVVDTSGAGDWLTAGFISELIKFDGCHSKGQFYSKNRLIDMLAQGMKYSQLCCAAIGAQGVFYSEKSVGAFNKLNNRFGAPNKMVLSNENIITDGLCPWCLSKIS